jgi:hypothetical protein
MGETLFTVGADVAAAGPVGPINPTRADVPRAALTARLAINKDLSGIWRMITSPLVLDGRVKK